MSKGVGVGGP